MTTICKATENEWGTGIMLRYLDANCQVKLVIEESGSNEVKAHFFRRGVVCASTTFCFYEALSVLKAKFVKKTRPDTISQEQYFAACEELCALVEDGNIQLEEIPFFDRATYRQSEKMASAHHIDLSDAFQLVTLKRGMFARLNIGRPVLISEDAGMLKAAQNELLEARSIAQL